MRNESADPELLLAAAHELGHVVLAQAYGIQVLSVEVHRDDYTGRTYRDLDADFDRFPPGLLRATLIGDVAGYEAEVIWCRKHGGTVHKRNSGADLRRFATYRRRVGLSKDVARREARRILLRNWRWIERTAPVLARRGRLTP